MIKSKCSLRGCRLIRAGSFTARGSLVRGPYCTSIILTNFVLVQEGHFLKNSTLRSDDMYPIQIKVKTAQGDPLERGSPVSLSKTICSQSPR